ncbi:MAG: type II CRISPR RNA-guided endonuclease Cas9 [Sphingobium sp.]
MVNPGRAGRSVELWFDPPMLEENLMVTSLGLDIGTNSIGWCLYDGNSIRDLGVRIFSDGREPSKLAISGAGIPLAVKRREARAARRRRDRYLGRRTAMLRELRRHGLLPADPQQAKALETQDPYDLRVKALDEKLEPHDIGRALFHLNQRRGFKSNRKAERKSKPGEDGKIFTGTKLLDEEMRRRGARTLGEFLVMRDEESGGTAGKRVRMLADSKAYAFYPDRRHVLEEFRAIWDKQKNWHPELLTEQAWNDIFRVIEYQRELKPQIVGKCTFAGINDVPADETRLPKAHPLFQQRRLYEEVNQLRVVSPGGAGRPLTLDERDALILKLQGKKSVSFKTLAKAIKLKDGERFNKESENRKALDGDEVRAELSARKQFGPRWLHFSDDEQWAIVERLLEEQDSETLLIWLKTEYGLDDATALAVANAKLPEGHGRFGLSATKTLLRELKADVCTYAEAAKRAGFHHSDFRTGEEFDQLPYYGEILSREIAPGKPEYGDENERRFGKITNPTVHIGLNQLTKLVNAIIRVHGRPDYIFVELARELKLNEKEKLAYNGQLKTNTQAARDRGAKLGTMGIRDTGRNRLILRLWAELNPKDVFNRRCPYCGKTIGQAHIQNNDVEIDHIVPYSQCFDDGIGNKVLVHTGCNRDKGNQTPWEKWGHDAEKWSIIQEQVGHLHRSKQWRFGPDARDRYAAEEGGFLPRQLVDTQYLTRIAAKYLASLYPERGKRHVFAVHGGMTAMLRRLWELNSILPDHNWVENPNSNAPKNRLDHRHNAIDAAVVGILTPKLIAEISKAAARAEKQNLDKLFDELPMPWARHPNGRRFRDELREKILAVTVSFKADHGRKNKPEPGRDITAGKLHNDTAYGFTGLTSHTGRPIVVHRISFASLTPKDIADPDRIPDAALREALRRATRDLSGKAFEKALLDFARDGSRQVDKRGKPLFKGIRRVRVREALTLIPIRDHAGKPYKGYLGDSNARYNVWQMPDGRWITHWKDHEGKLQSSVISTFDFHQPGFVEQRPHPAAKKVLSLRQDDLIAIERDGAPRQIMRVQKYGQNGQIFLIEHNEAGNMAERNKNAEDPFKFYGPGASALRKMKARQIRIDELGRIFDPGPR